MQRQYRACGRFYTLHRRSIIGRSSRFHHDCEAYGTESSRPVDLYCGAPTQIPVDAEFQGKKEAYGAEPPYNAHL